MTARAHTLKKLAGVKPFGVLECEAAALCAMSTTKFKAACNLSPAVVGNRRIYNYNDVSVWFENWHAKQQNAATSPNGESDWLGEVYNGVKNESPGRGRN